MASALVSIVINNFNYARYLSQTIDSALSQTHPVTEVVVVDDASADDSRSVIRRYGDRIIPVLLDQNGGQGAAINAGFRKSRGEIVIFLDADDYLYPQAAERVVSAWRPGISKLQYRLHLVDREGNKIDLFPAPEIRFDSGDVVPLLLAAGRYEATVTSGNAFSRGALEKTLPIPQEEFRIAADGYLVTLVPLCGPVASLEEPLGAYRQHGENAWSPGRNGLSAQLRHALLHDAHRYAALREKALKLGLELVPSPGLHDHSHLTTRISSLCVDPKQHPHAGDSRLALALRGVLSSRHARLPWKRRAILAAWFVAMGILPRPAAAKLVAWRMFPASRPLAPLFKAVRRMAG
jgi:hypothetical protein